jgi:glutamate-ammonia-ligase adenylyltransferase
MTAIPECAVPKPDLASIPAPLRAGVGEAWEGFIAAGGDPAILGHEAVGPTLLRVWACSRFVAGSCVRRPAMLAELAAAGELTRARAAGETAALIAAAAGPDAGEAALMKALRQARQRELVRIAWRDLCGWSTLEESLEELSALADACIRTAVDRAERSMAERHGEPAGEGGEAQRLVVIAMGKLGGRELNFSSDVDLVFVFPSPGQTSGRRALSNAEFFTRVAQRAIHFLSTPTEDGFVLRVDARLRPFGESGALVLHLRALEAYLQEHGREWERYAYVKARLLSGRDADRAELEGLLRPFVYRRYLDFGVFESLRRMRDLILREVERRELRDDVKLGPGGIREIEFIVQAIQLLRGGRDPALQSPALAAALARIRERRYLDETAVRALSDAYRFLRHLENRLQAYGDEQTHALPADDAGWERLALAMALPHRAALEQALEGERSAVSAQFASVVLGPEREARADSAPLLGVWDGSMEVEQARARLAALGFERPDDALTLLRDLRTGSAYARLDRRARQRLDALMPRLLSVLSEAGAADEARLGRGDPHATLTRVLGVIEAIGQRSAYLALLAENPAALRRLVQLAATSPLIARQVAVHPLLLDDLLDPRLFEAVPARAELAADLAQRFTGVALDDLEMQMDALRQFQQSALLRIAVCDLNGVLPLIEVSNRLTDVAELVLGHVLRLARAQLEQRHGVAHAAAGPAGFAVIGYGKLGGYELAYDSDLDVVFLHDAADGQTDGGKPVDNTVFFARLASRMLHFLSTQTHSGTLYQVDTRLRPSGSKGLLVSGVDAFADYQHGHAWTWEHQAILRARPVAGDEAVAARFARIRRDVLCAERDCDALRRDVIEMRERMRRELSRAGAGEFDVKQDAGGIVDIEFLVQYLVLREARAHPEVIEYTDNLRQLQGLARIGAISRGDADALFAAYRRYRSGRHARALRGERRAAVRDDLGAERAFVQQLWARVFET